MAEDNAAPLQLEERYRRAAAGARSLPNDLLSNAQRLKLYALFKQAEGPAPLTAPSRIHAINFAKWEAWNDVRSLTSDQAMESYCSIIEGLISITESEQGGTTGPAAEAAAPAAAPATAPPPPPPDAAPAPEPPAAAPAQPTAAAVAVAAGVLTPAGAVSSPEPTVDTQRWATSALNLAAGAVFEMPMAVTEPSLCTYSFTVNGADAYACGFSLAQGAEPLVTIRGVKEQGTVELAGAEELLVAKIDNLGSVFQSIAVACTIIVQPLSQLQALEQYRQRLEIREQLAQTEADLAMQAVEVASITAEEATLKAKLAAMEEAMKQVQLELVACGSRMAMSERQTLALEAEKASLHKSLGGEAEGDGEGEGEAVPTEAEAAGRGVSLIETSARPRRNLGATSAQSRRDLG
eukprot:CAMPEP_0183352538 /NCGR_PEP_ID=MMETSP0164_2-20130417/29501_1 /TAXON_ID=221442 /ORGANISM="Coccolithus pelagicus ssp braarudi, Strain PLY182g" /LENGTH=406 /DNA_ID=CAMNT_0025524993 /DNA_START=30 /DNA_END=1246 /DNA_ORIENTATION=-